MEFRFHPIIEGLKVSEDGSVIIRDGNPLKIYTQRLPHPRRDRKLVRINEKAVTIIRLVAEAWIGMPPNIGAAARRLDESKGDHYTNVFWGKQGMTESSCIGHEGVKASRKINKDDLEIIEERRALRQAQGDKQGERLIDILKDYDASEMAYYRAKKRYGRKKG